MSSETAAIIRRLITGLFLGILTGMLLTLAYAWALSNAWLDEKGMLAVSVVINLTGCVAAGLFAAFGIGGARWARGAGAGLLTAVAMTIVFLALSGETLIVRELLINGASGCLAGLLSGVLAEFVG